VAEPKLRHRSLQLLSFTEEMLQQGEATQARVLELGTVMPPPRVASDLEIGAAEMATKLVRVRYAGNTPLLLETNYIPSALCPGLEHMDLEQHSLYTVLERDYGLLPSRTRQTVEAVMPGGYEAEALDIPTNLPLIQLEGITYTAKKRPMQSFKAVFRSDRFKFEMDSQPDTAEAHDGNGHHVSLVFGSTELSHASERRS
jgi:GntR family transcriptional regulator